MKIEIMARVDGKKEDLLTITMYARGDVLRMHMKDSDGKSQEWKWNR